MEKNLSLVHYSNLANSILEAETDYMRGKKLISNFFSKNKSITLEDIKLRLIIIDSMYSTQMNRRLFGIEELANELYTISEGGNDYSLVNKSKEYIDSSNTCIENIFSKKFGIDKKGKVKGVASSLISKYIYFLMDYEFPIYDRLVKDYLPKINKRYNVIPMSKPKSIDSYFAYISDFNKKSNINSYNKLDNLCWFYGKVSEGSFSLLITKEKYIKLISYSDINEKMKSDEIDKKISSTLKVSIPHNIFSDEEVEFIEWVYHQSKDETNT